MKHRHEISDVNHLQEELDDQSGSLVTLSTSTTEAMQLMVDQLAELTERVASLEAALLEKALGGSR